MFYLVIVLSFIMLIYIMKISTKSIHMLQQNLYNENNRYLKWIFRNPKQSLINLNLYGILFAILMLFSQVEMLDMFFIVILCSLYIVSYFIDKGKQKKDQNKKPLVITKRVKRLIFTIGVIYLLPFILLVINFDWLKDCLFIIALLISFNYIVVFIANIINYPIEKMIYKHYERKAKTKLKSLPNLKVVGITGSYGKTSSKNILNDILKDSYNTLATPKSINTFNGIMIIINNKLSKFDDVFIVEMGAYVRGEIKGLSELVKPKYGIITNIGTAHLETFGSEENIQIAKMELIEKLPSDGVGILNRDDSKQRKYKVKNDCKIVWIGIESEDADVRAKNIKTNNKGSTFDVVFKGDKKEYKFETKLLGKHNIYNILSSLALAKEFGLKIDSLKDAVKNVQPIEHRLELKRIGNFYQIDDAYNSNPVGAKAALDVLSMMDGMKIVVTPGMIELGKKEKELNQEFGRQISEVADAVILIGKNRTLPIKKGLLEKKYKEKNIYVLNDVREAYTLIEKLKTDKKDVYALFENDLPDTYNE